MYYYCEAPLIGAWFEPVNTLSNLAFIVAAVLLWRVARAAGKASLRRQLYVLTALLAAIGLGSGLWHFFRTDWALLLDVVPIQLFLLVFAWFLAKRVFSSAAAQLLFVGGLVGAAFVGPLVVSQLSWWPTDAGGEGYVGPLLFALLVTPLIWRRTPKAGKLFFTTVLIFCISLLLRQLDGWWCEALFGVGTHLFWHTLNAVVLYRFARTLMV